MIKNVKYLLLGVLGLAVIGCGKEEAKEVVSWPPATINFICTHGAGGDTDYNTRLIARKLEAKLGVPVVVTNVTGGNGSIAMTQYKDADNSKGDTFIVTNTTALAANETTEVTDFGYDSFEPVAIFGRQSGECFVVNAKSPVNSMKEFVEYTKNNKSVLGIAMGSSSHISAVILQNEGAKFNVLDAGDAATRTTSLIGGHVDATIIPYTSAKEYVENGDIKILATLLSSRLPVIPDVPTAVEAGTNLTVDTKYAVLAPKGTDKDVVEKLNAAIVEIVKTDADYAKEIKEYNFQDPYVLSVEETIADLDKQRNYFLKYKEFLN